ncbi:MAG: peptidylprolyl isomerase [Bryobacteraceae bacterium]
MYLRVFVLLGAAAAAVRAADVRVIEEIVAKVNGDIITRSEIERGRHMLELELRQQGLTGAKLAETVDGRAKDALRDQIDQMLLVQKAKDLNINVDPDVTRRIAEIQVQSKIADPDKFHEWIREQSGMTFEDFRQQMKNQLLTQRVIGQEVSSRIAVAEADKRKYYEEHKAEFVRQEQVFLRQILISTEGKTPEQAAAAEKKAKDVLARAKRGEKFNELARDFSDDQETARNQGELPPFKRGELRKEIEDIVFKQRKGFITDLIKVPNGYLILKVEERWEPGQASYEEVENEITERLAMPLMQPKVRTYLTKLRQDAFLEIRSGYVDSGAAPGKDTTWKDPAQLKPETVTKEEVAARRKRRLLWIIPLPSGKAEKKDTIGSSQPAPVPAPAAKP